MIKSRLILLSSALALVTTSQVRAQFIDVEQLCSQLKTRGLYYAYVDIGGQITARSVISGQMHYDVNAKFIYVPPAGQLGANEEGVWHIKTQTFAAAAPRANKVYVYRPQIVSRCSAGATLPNFDRNDRFVELNRYIDYHAPNRNRERERQLHDYFHFKMQDPDTGDCSAGIWTDDASLLGHYVFENIRREDTPTDYEVASSVVTSASAAPKTEASSPYQGLSSEFAYRVTAGAACVSFNPPLPTGPVPHKAGFFGWFSNTEANAIEAASIWKPRTTSVVLKRLRGRKVIDQLNAMVNWEGK